MADVVCFKGPHINHLTPRTLDIDAAHEAMRQRGIDAKMQIEGPPRRRVPILLRQTSFKALEEKIIFRGEHGDAAGTHTARFGEIEQRGMALTRKGRERYDALLAQAITAKARSEAEYQQHLARVFEQFPDDLDAIRREGLGYFTYRRVIPAAPSETLAFDLEALLKNGDVVATPVVYEDFLPVSAAGIFQSNLGGTEPKTYSASRAKAAFEDALGATVADPFELYDALQAQSIEQVRAGT